MNYRQQRMDYARQRFFSTRVGTILGRIAWHLTVRFPNSRLIERLWSLTLPF